MMNKQGSFRFPERLLLFKGLAIFKDEEEVWIYRAGQDTPEVVEGFAGKRLSDAAVLPGFELPRDTMRREH